ncbi:hypothetical protein B296_00054013 [Ensete ventricosum]|uniref:Uncharacterized protein n=1 Tax=Ensete ventricosum TaxID=4639 RepID=A0A426Y5J1_ENSVE|nr:hypothetical protein B296_00054013 [Ensete ventricosum]
MGGSPAGADGATTESTLKTRVGVAADKGRGHWQRGDLGVKKRRSESYSRRSRGCFVSVALRKKTLAMPKGHERLRAMAAMAMAATVMPDQRRQRQQLRRHGQHEVDRLAHCRRGTSRVARIYCR